MATAYPTDMDLPKAPELPRFPSTGSEDKPAVAEEGENVVSDAEELVEKVEDVATSETPVQAVIPEEVEDVEPQKAAETSVFTEPTEPVSTSIDVGEVKETQVERLIYWRDPMFTGVIFGVVNVVSFLTLIKKFTFLSLYSYVGMLLTTGCFIYINGSKLLVGYLGEDALPKPTFGLEKFSSEAIHAKVDSSVDSLNEIMHLIRDIVVCKDNVTTLKAIGILYVTYLVGKIMPDLIFFYFIFLSIFTLPKIYEMNKDEIDKAAGEAQTKFLEEKDKVMKIAGERSIELRATVAKKVQETATPLMEKVQPRIDEFRQRVMKSSPSASSSAAQ